MDMDQPRPPMISRQDMQVFEVFEVVRKGLAETSTVGWDNAHVSIKLATDVYRSPVGKGFLLDYLTQITGIMLDQARRDFYVLQLSGIYDRVEGTSLPSYCHF